MATIEVNGTTLAYEDTGPGSTGETIAFSHGLLWDRSLFAPQIAALRARYRCIAWDHRGQGDSAADPTRQCIGIELVTQDAIALLERVAGGPVHFCGLSMGGFVAMRIAARRPELVRSVILVETSADREPIENLPKFRVMNLLTRFISPRVVITRALPVMFSRDFLDDPARAAERAKYTTVMTRRRDVWRAVNGVLDRGAVLDELARIHAPTLIIVGDQDVATVPAKSAAIHAGIPGSTLVTIPRAGHSSTVEQPAAVTAAIEAFLLRVPPRGDGVRS
jgi:pimeloyl-ACP methyl ester carboxylesterase